MEGMHIHGYGEKMFSKQHKSFDRLKCKHQNEIYSIMHESYFISIYRHFMLSYIIRYGM